MNYPPSNSEKFNKQVSSSFQLLNQKVQKWIWSQNWLDLRDIQEISIPYLLNGNTDLIISSPTASGKTEAAFLPIFSNIVDKPANSIQAIYISPLKALINDQFERLYKLSEVLEIKIIKWHGDISYSHKQKLIKNPSGVLQITPESLESFLINRFSNCSNIFSNLEYIVIDELHYFIGSERGKQLQSLLNRIEIILKRSIPRIGLSATLGDMSIAEKYLRPMQNYPIRSISSEGMHQETKLQIKGYLSSSLNKDKPTQAEIDDEQEVTKQIAYHIFNNLRGKSNLIFANSRRSVEKYADSLTQISNYHNLPLEFYPHHGSLSKHLREEVEEKLKNKNFPTSAICTSTLELGIDIGVVHSIAQIGVPPSVSSLRQRLGRSGRRDQPAILRVYIEEKEINISSTIQDKLRTELFQSVAIIELLIKKWYEPPTLDQLHLSTLLHQVLALIVQYGGISIKNVWQILIENGPFKNLSQNLFINLLKTMKENKLIFQSEEGIIVLGVEGERIVNNYEFYAVFQTPEEYRLITSGKALGTLPINFPLYVGLFIIFAGKRWEVINVDEEKKLIELKPSIGGKLPKFFGSGGIVHDMIRKEMLTLYTSKHIPPYLDEVGKSLYNEGLESFKTYELSSKWYIQDGKDVTIFFWFGDRLVNTLLVYLQLEKFKVQLEGFCIRVLDIDIEKVRQVLDKLKGDELTTDFILATLVKNKREQKYDHYLNEELLNYDYSSRKLNFDELKNVVRKYEN